MNEYKVGDVLRVRQWDDMEHEFGLNGGSDSSIRCRYTFTREMEYMCGAIFTVKEIFGGRYTSVEGLEQDKTGFIYSISSDMLEPYVEQEVVVDDTAEALLSSFLSSFGQNN